MAQLEKILAERSIKLSGSKEQITELQSQLAQLNRKIETTKGQWESKVNKKKTKPNEIENENEKK